jgi:Cof subfamily protein (haloacid dehalogenase superfamily)
MIDGHGIKAVFFDIDWTLYDHRGKRWSAESLADIKALKNRGIKCIICTARPYDSLRKFGVFDLGIDWDGFVASAGSIAWTDGQLICEFPMEAKEVGSFISAAKKAHLTLEIVGPCTRKLVLPQTEDSIAFYKDFNESVPPFGPYRGEKTLALNLFSDQASDAQLFKIFPDLFFFRYSKHAVDVTPVPHEKGLALEKVISHYGFATNECLGFGDDVQDISFCRSVGHFVCMGNGREELKRISEFVTKPVWDDGVAYALAAYGLVY